MIARAIRRPALSRATTFARSFAPAARLVHTEKKIEELGFTLPPPAKPLATYVPWVRTGNAEWTLSNAEGSPTRVATSKRSPS